MATIHALSTSEVESRVRSYRPAFIAELFGFGAIVWQDARATATTLDTKGIAVLGFSGAFLAFILSTPSTVVAADAVRLLRFLAGAGALIAVVLSAMALRVKARLGPSDPIWFPPPATIQDELHLRRHYVECLHQMTADLTARNVRRGLQLSWAQSALALAAIAAGVAVFLTT